MLNPATARIDSLRFQVERLYDANRQVGTASWCGHDYDFVCPSTGTYPFQWFWDSCFHAIVLSRFDVRRAEVELQSLMRNQQPDGFVAHVTFWQREKYEALLKNYCILYRTPYLSDCIQPPVLAHAFDAVAQRGGSAAFVSEMLPKVCAYFDWLDQVRDPDQDGLIAVLLPDETGLDHTPKFDHYYLERQEPTIAHYDQGWENVAARYREVGQDPKRMFALDKFIVEDTMMNALYAEGQRLLSLHLKKAGQHARAEVFAARARRSRDALVSKCFDPDRGLFFDLAGAREAPLQVSTFTSLCPLLLGDLPTPQVDALVRHLESADYALPFPVPTVARGEPTFQAEPVGTRLLWRGPSWINSNWLICQGLYLHGFKKLADQLADASAALVEKGGFREYYNPYTGEGYGAQSFSWSALVLDLLIRREEG